MKAQILATPPEDHRTEWRRTNALIEDVQNLHRATSSHPHLVEVKVLDGGGIVFDFSGLITALEEKNIPI